MRYAEYLPSPRLARLVERFWFLEGASTGTVDAIIPDGRMELVFHYSGTFWRHTDASSPLRQPASLLVGQMTSPVVLAPEGVAGVAAIRLRSAAARTLLGFSVREVSEQFVDLESIFPSAAALRERLAEAADDRARLAALERWLVDSACPSPRAEVEAAVQAILKSHGRASVDALAMFTGLGVRRLSGSFGRRGAVAENVLNESLAAGRLRLVQGRPLSDVALACGFTPGAHDPRPPARLDFAGRLQSHAGELAPVRGRIAPHSRRFGISMSPCPERNGYNRRLRQVGRTDRRDAIQAVRQVISTTCPGL